ncbi:MAG TPA: 2,3,4,5-tetrahydropyridine-2,6-dicarboxylate N-succinyltransferase [Candidatus Binatia bacterium]|nr:2,3,4,5-tetrahydropyridine-2,6-dicarboxylate N-succinyltransferase [Candidatus Binatia bacterium]
MGNGDLLVDLERGERRAAWPDPEAPGGWRVDPDVKAEILQLFETEDVTYALNDLFRFRDRAGLPTRRELESVRVVPGGTSIRAGSHLGPGVVVMPPSFVNIGAWIGSRTMIDSHVLVGSCAQIGENVHLAAGVQIGGVLEPPNARPVIVEDEAFIGAGCGLFEGVLIGRRAVLGAGVILTGTSRIYDLVSETILRGTPEQPLAVPPDAVVVPGTRPAAGAFAERHGVGFTTAVIVKRRDRRTEPRVALEEALR